MKAILLLILVISFPVLLFAQDLIVKTDGDSINCKITKVKDGIIYFTYQEGKELLNTLLFTDKVKIYQYNYSSTAIVNDKDVRGNMRISHFRLAVNGGLGYRLGKISSDVPSEFKQYVKDLKSGYSYGVDMSYYFNEKFGAGFKYSVFSSNNEMDDIYVKYSNGTIKSGKMSDDISLSFIGPCFMTRYYRNDSQNYLLMNIGLGYLGYTNKAVLITDYTIKGNTVGLCAELGYDLALSENIAIGFLFSYVAGVMTEYELSDGITSNNIELDKENYESLNHLNLSVGLRFLK